jgi:hypothetical protein
LLVGSVVEGKIGLSRSGNAEGGYRTVRRESERRQRGVRRAPASHIDRRWIWPRSCRPRKRGSVLEEAVSASKRGSHLLSFSEMGNEARRKLAPLRATASAW